MRTFRHTISRTTEASEGGQGTETRQAELPHEFSLWHVFTRPDLNRNVKDALDARLRGGPRKHERITVTDLVNPVGAYWRRKRPDIQPPTHRLERMRAGTGFHQLFTSAVVEAQFAEQLVELDGIVGKIDFFEDVVTELKSTDRTVRKADLPKAFGSWIEQLAMYVVMVGRDAGRLVVHTRGLDGRGPPLDVYDMKFIETDWIKAEMLRRRDAIVDALERDDPSKLGRCSYFTSCEYRDACACAEAKTEHVATIAERAREIAARPDVAHEFEEKVARARPRTGGLNELVFPRKAFLEKQAAEAGEEGEADDDEEAAGAAKPFTEMDKYGLQMALARDLFAGRGGETTFKPCAFEGVEARVRLHMGVPTLFRVSPFERVVDPQRAITTWQHYFLRLAFECAMANVARGRLVVYYKNAERDLSRIVVYDASVRDMAAVRDEMKRRADALAAARAAGASADPKTLPACPPWMAKFCAFAERCGCGGSGAEGVK